MNTLIFDQVFAFSSCWSYFWRPGSFWSLWCKRALLWRVFKYYYFLSKYCQSLFVGFRKSRHSLCRSCSCWASWYCNGGKVWIENNFSFTNARKFHSGLWSQNHLCLLGLSLSYRLLCWLNTGKRTCKWCWKNVRAILYTNMYTVYNMNTKFNDIFESKPPASQSTKERWVKRKSELSSTGL